MRGLMTICGVLWFGAAAFAAPLGSSTEQAIKAGTNNPELVVAMPQDSYGRQTPRQALAGLMRAYTTGDTKLAVRYLEGKTANEETAKQLYAALDVGGELLPDLQLSDEPEGDTQDLLPTGVDKVGSIVSQEGTTDVLMSRKKDKSGQYIWQISEKTLQNLPKLQKSKSFVDSFGFAPLEQYRLFGYTLSSLIGLLVVLGASLLASFVVVWLLFYAVKWAYPKLSRQNFAITPRIILPLSLVMVTLFLPDILLKAGVPVTLRASVGKLKEAVAWGATTWLLVRVLDAVFFHAQNLSVRKNLPEQVSILGLLRKLAKALLLILAVIVVFGNLGFDLTTGIAALGVGGLALAFGAQKTIENLIGSVVVVADRPVRVGDYCKFGVHEGRVIDIGIRSTRVRTLNRTVVTIPNGEFSSLQIENYATRDMFHFLHHIYLKKDTPSSKIAKVIQAFCEHLQEHPEVNDEWTQVRISELRQDCHVLELRAYIATDDVVVFYEKQSTLILELLGLMEEMGVAHALPAQELKFEALTNQAID